MEDKKRISIITIIGIIIIISIMVIIILYQISGLNNNSNSTYSNNKIYDLKGEENVEYDENGKKFNTSEKIRDGKVVSQVSFGNFNISSYMGATKITYDIQNLGLESVKIDGYEFFFYDSKNKCIGSIKTDGIKLGVEEIRTLDIIVEADIVNIYDIHIKQTYSKSI